MPPDAPPPQTEATRQESEIEFSRIVAFTDGVFAIAITLLVLALEVPPNVSNLADALSDQSSNLLAYAISFAVLARFWMAHHRFFASLERFNTTLIGLNLLYLAFVALIPFTTQLLGNYADQSGALIAYALSMVCVTASFRAQVLYALRRRMMEESAYTAEDFVGWGGYIAIGVFALSIPIALVAPELTPWSWLVMFLVGGRVSEWAWRRFGHSPD